MPLASLKRRDAKPVLSLTKLLQFKAKISG